MLGSRTSLSENSPQFFAARNQDIYSGSREKRPSILCLTSCAPQQGQATIATRPSTVAAVVFVALETTVCLAV